MITLPDVAAQEKIMSVFNLKALVL